MDVAPFLKHLRSREAAARAADTERARDARARLGAVVRLLTDEFGVTRVVLFGSLLRGVLHEGSDVDLAVENLAPARYWEALVRCSEAAGRDVELVPIEDARPSLRARIAAEGEVLLG